MDTAPLREAIRDLYPHATLYHPADAGRDSYPSDLEVLLGLMATDRAAVENGKDARGIAGDRAHAIRETGRRAAGRLAKAEALIAQLQ